MCFSDQLRWHVRALEGLTGIVPTAPPRRAEPRAAWAHPHAEIGSYGTHANGPLHRRWRHIGPLEGLTGIVPTAPPPAAARRAEPPAAWAHPQAEIGSYGNHANGPLHRRWRHIGPLEGLTGIEPALSAWEAEVLPLNYSPMRRGAPPAYQDGWEGP